MNRRPPFAPGNYYHLYNRGRSRLSIFHDEQDYLNVLARLRTYSQKFAIQLIAYALLPNHYHFLVRQDGDVRAGVLPQRIFNGYAKYYNRRYNHSGTIFEGPYEAILIKDESHLRHLCRYIHANPVKHGLANALDEWAYTNYPEWMGLRQGTLWDAAFVDAYFPDREAYQAYVLELLR